MTVKEFNCEYSWGEKASANKTDYGYELTVQERTYTFKTMKELKTFYGGYRHALKQNGISISIR